ncbi:MAG: DUF3794 domain-containing protein [Oscillospiraceae bacterium]|nr:DUF3794 domain-containing protein [Oscillospiraceae bacterium]
MGTSNELTLHRETILVPAKLLDTVSEQSVELDCVLPDYYPDFFRLLSCTAEPTVTNRELRDHTLTLSLSVKITVWYLAENSPLIQVMTQKLAYQKQIPWQSDCALDEVSLSVTPSPSYINCRAVNSRRMDIRGAVRLAVQAVGMTPKQVLSDVSGMYTHCRKSPVSFVSGIRRGEKRCTVSEEIAIPDAQPPLLSVLRTELSARITESRCIAGKLIVKGEALLSLLYTAKDSVETLLRPIPLSQIIELDGLEDNMPCTVQASVLEHLLTTEADSGGDIRKFHLDIQLRFDCEAVKTAAAELVTDLYSTVCPIAVQQESLPLAAMPQAQQSQVQVQAEIRQTEREIARVYAVWADVRETSLSAAETGETVLQGSLTCFVLAADAEGMPMLLTQTEAVSVPYTGGGLCPKLTVSNCSYMLSSAACVAVQAELTLTAHQMQQSEYALLTDAQANAEERLPQTGGYALRLYFAQAEESLWEIAKRYHTAASAIMEENDCREDILQSPQMLLIPIVQ